MKNWVRRLLCLSLASALLLGVAAYAEDAQKEQEPEEEISAQIQEDEQNEEISAYMDEQEEEPEPEPDPEPEEPEPEPEPEPETISLSPGKLSLTEGTSGTITASISAGGSIADCYSSDDTVATVSYSGSTITVSAQSQGTCTITVVTAAGNQQTASVTVSAKETPVKETVTLSPNELYLTVGSTGTMTVTISPSGSISECYSDNTAVASVSRSGNTITVTAKAQGECSIVVITKKGSRGTGAVTVSVAGSPNTPGGSGSSIMNPTPSTIQSGGTIPTTTLTSKYTMPDNIPKNVMLTVDSNLGKATDTMLDDLYTYDCFATFFVKNDSIYKHDDRVRRIVGEGHSIGILLDADSVKTSKKALKELEEANSKLSTVSGAATRLVSIEGGSEGVLSKKVYKALTKAGYRVWDYDYEVNSSVSSEDAFEALEKKLDTKERVVVRMTSGAHAMKVMKETLGFINYAEIPTQSVVSSDIPVCSVK